MNNEFIKIQHNATYDNYEITNKLLQDIIGTFYVTYKIKNEIEENYIKNKMLPYELSIKNIIRYATIEDIKKFKISYDDCQNKLINLRTINHHNLSIIDIFKMKRKYFVTLQLREPIPFDLFEHGFRSYIESSGLVQSERTFLGGTNLYFKTENNISLHFDPCGLSVMPQQPLEGLDVFRLALDYAIKIERIRPPFNPNLMFI